MNEKQKTGFKKCAPAPVPVLGVPPAQQSSLRSDGHASVTVTIPVLTSDEWLNLFGEHESIHKALAKITAPYALPTSALENLCWAAYRHFSSGGKA